MFLWCSFDLHVFVPSESIQHCYSVLYIIIVLLRLPCSAVLWFDLCHCHYLFLFQFLLALLYLSCLRSFNSILFYFYCLAFIISFCTVFLHFPVMVVIATPVKISCLYYKNVISVVHPIVHRYMLVFITNNFLDTLLN